MSFYSGVRSSSFVGWVSSRTPSLFLASPVSSCSSMLLNSFDDRSSFRKSACSCSNCLKLFSFGYSSICFKLFVTTRFVTSDLLWLLLKLMLLTGLLLFECNFFVSMVFKLTLGLVVESGICFVLVLFIFVFVL